MGTYDPGRQWKEFGARDPYYGVLSEERFKIGQIDDISLKEFYDSGDSHIENILGLVRRHMDPGFTPVRGLDFGCGVGRLTIPLSRRCREVTGVDVSRGMLEKGRENAVRMQAGEIAWVESGSVLPPLEPGYNFMCSDIVFQHIPLKQGLGTFGQMLGLLASGGVFALHFPVKSLSWKKTLYFWAAKNIPYFYNAWNLLKRRAWSYPHMQMNMYPLDKLMDVLKNNGISGCYMEFRRGGWTSDVLLIGRKK